MCNQPLYRLVLSEVVQKYVSPRLRRRIKGDGIIMNKVEFETLVNVYSIPQWCFQTIPCGKCLGCMFDYQAQWTTRAILESTLHKSNYFCTLTYNDDNIPLKPILNARTGETMYCGELLKEDFTSFVKRFRASNDYVGLPPFRFLACGERGDTTKRPHFHFLGFGLEFNDLVYYYSKARDGTVHYDFRQGSTQYFLSKRLSDAWGNGFVLVTPLTVENCAYVCSYVNKKVTPSTVVVNRNDNKLWERFYRQFDNYNCTVDNAVSLGMLNSPFLHMSRRNGLAYDCFDEMWYDYFTYDKLPLVNGKALPKRTLRYFDERFKKNGLEFMLDVMKKKRFSKNYVEYLQWSDFGQRERDIREELLRKKVERKKPRDL